MAQPQEYQREYDFTERDGDDTNHAEINAELDGAALSINQIRDNLALIQRDDGALANGIVTAAALAAGLYDEITETVAGGIDGQVLQAETAAAAANIAATSANTARDQTLIYRNESEAFKNASAANATSAASSAQEALEAAGLIGVKYLGPSATEPTERLDGSPVQIGDLYFDTTLGYMQVYTDSGWMSANTNPLAALTVYKFTAVGGETVFSGVDDNGSTLAYSAAGVFIAANGAVLTKGVDYTAIDGTSFTLTDPAIAADLFEVYTFNKFVLTEVPAINVAAEDGSGGSLWSTVQGFINRIKGAFGAASVGYTPAGTGAVETTVEDILDAQLMVDYTALRAYTGLAENVYITGLFVTSKPSGIAGRFKLTSDTTSLDNNSTIIVDALGRRWKRVYQGAIQAAWFGVIADGATLNTTALQSVFDAAPNNTSIEFDAGTIKTGNITIPNKRLKLIGQGQWQTNIEAQSGAISNSNYLIASAAYVNNSTFGNDPIEVDGISFNGAGLVDNVFVLYGYFSELKNSKFQGPGAATGAALLVTGNGIGGSACSTTLVENKILNCRLDGSSVGRPFSMTDTGAKCTDMDFKNNIVKGGLALFRSMAGHNILGNHFYGGSAQFSRLSLGTTIDSNYFENTVLFDDFIEEVVSANNNTFLGRVTVSFGASGKTMLLGGNKFQGAADLLHNFFGADKHIIVNGGGFETATPVVFSNGASTGRVTFNRVYSFSDNSILEGTRTGNTGRIRRVFTSNLAPTTGTWTQGDIVWQQSPVAGGYIGFVCVASGTPGTWKEWGAILP